MNDDEDEDVDGIFVKRTLMFIMIMTLKISNKTQSKYRAKVKLNKIITQTS